MLTAQSAVSRTGLSTACLLHVYCMPTACRCCKWNWAVRRKNELRTHHQKPVLTLLCCSQIAFTAPNLLAVQNQTSATLHTVVLTELEIRTLTLDLLLVIAPWIRAHEEKWSINKVSLCLFFHTSPNRQCLNNIQLRKGSWNEYKKYWRVAFGWFIDY